MNSKVARSRAKRRMLSVSQATFAGSAASLVLIAGWFSSSAAILIIIATLQVGFLINAAWRILLVRVSRKPPLFLLHEADIDLPNYTILIALHDEVDVVDQLIDRLARIDYPSHKLQGLILLEAHDHATIDAVQQADRPWWLTPLVLPAGTPTTKPRALNAGLAHAIGEFVTVYDAEDDPDPLQLREAVARFRADPDHSLSCLQAPLRIRVADGDDRHAFLNRQFAVEYAALFEVTLPGMARLGFPFPLGGTSNHFRVDVLRSIGGWDAWNVTEDADLGFQLWRHGWRSGMLTRPTHEAPPGGIAVWLPQRTRWLKGFMQTLGVHTRDVRGLGAKGFFALIITLAFTLASAALHAFVLAWVAATVLVALVSGLTPLTPVFALTVPATGTVAALGTGWIGASRAGVRYSLTDMLLSPIYWSLLTLAFGHALWRLIRDPFTWDKTPHRASRSMSAPVAAIQAEPEPAGREAA